MIMWWQFLHNFYTSVIVYSWKEFCNIYIWLVNVSSVYLRCAVIKKLYQTFAYCGPLIQDEMCVLHQFLPDHPTYLSETPWTLSQQLKILDNLTHHHSKYSWTVQNFQEYFRGVSSENEICRCLHESHQMPNLLQ